MISPYKTFYLLSFYFLIASFCLLPAEEYERPTMAVQGHAVLRKPADELKINLAVISQAKTADEALRINNQKIQRVIEELRQLGLTHTEYQTSQFNIYPTYSFPPKEPPADWKATIIGYEVTNQIAIQTSHLDLAGPIIDKSSLMGVNSVDHISFNLKNKRAYQAEVVALATQYAIEDAQLLAQAAHVQLLRVLYISLNQADPLPRPQHMAAYASRHIELADSGTSISAGDVDISADVTIIYEIQ